METDPIDEMSEQLAVAVRCIKLLEKVDGIDGWQKPTFPAYAWPGGYPLIYVTKHGEVICAECMNDASNAHNNFASQEYGDPVIGCDTYDEGPAEYCANCNAEIESSYGDPDDPKEQD